MDSRRKIRRISNGGPTEIEGNMGHGLSVFPGPPYGPNHTGPQSLQLATSGRGSTPGAVRSPQGSVLGPHSQSCSSSKETVSMVFLKSVDSLRGSLLVSRRVVWCPRRWRGALAPPNPSKGLGARICHSRHRGAAWLPAALILKLTGATDMSLGRRGSRG